MWFKTKLEHLTKYDCSCVYNIFSKTLNKRGLKIRLKLSTSYAFLRGASDSETGSKSAVHTGELARSKIKERHDFWLKISHLKPWFRCRFMTFVCEWSSQVHNVYRSEVKSIILANFYQTWKHRVNKHIGELWYHFQVVLTLVIHQYTRFYQRTRQHKGHETEQDPVYYPFQP